MDNPFTVPFFDAETFPFAIARDFYKKKISLVNTKELTLQVLIDAKTPSQGFCIKMPGKAFDFHFLV